MKPEEVGVCSEGVVEDMAPVAGDVIGDTAYSERFVLKILLKFANTDSLKDEIQEKDFEDDLCTLWDMTAEKDVVLFTLKHDVLNLFNFALPSIDSQRIIEIIIGTIGNMCCCAETVNVLMKMDGFLRSILEYIKTDDSMTLVQVLRLVSSCLFLAEDEHLAIWMKMFHEVEYSVALYFIMKNSSHKDLLVTSLENLNTVTSYFNNEKYQSDIFKLFVTLDALGCVSTAFREIFNQSDFCERDELERVLVITLQIMINLLGFDKSPEIYNDSKDAVVKVITGVLTYYENKTVNQKEIDADINDIIDSTNTILGIMKLGETSEPDAFFSQTYVIWKTLHLMSKTDNNGSSFDDEDNNRLQDFASKISPPLCNLIGIYIETCSEENLNLVLDKISSDYSCIVDSISDDQTKANVVNRTSNYRSRLKDDVQSK